MKRLFKVGADRHDVGRVTFSWHPEGNFLASAGRNGKLLTSSHLFNYCLPLLLSVSYINYTDTLLLVSQPFLNLFFAVCFFRHHPHH